MASDSSERYVLLNRLADEFAERYRRGERPSLQEYVDRHPDLAADIREYFPAMVEMEQVKEDGREVQEPGAAGLLPALQRLGDYRILREIGHGGMGVVYEAEQVSLGRHVALKLLPQKLLVDARTKRRFEREAKAAAKLHHTNIVPVFGVGEHEGLPYYVMQFIQGLGLDEVLEELKRLQGGAAAGSAPRSSRGELRVSRREVSAAEVARSLLTGCASPAAEEGDAPVIAADATALHAPAAGADKAPPAEAHAGRLSDTFSLSGSPVILPGTGSGRQPGKKQATYWQSVARIGVQVAEALEYAHRQGIQHRDVKPSNLLLDTAGTVWVTDFGLAKADDQQNLTHTGDVLGTLRYMPPEAFDGKTDVRSDVYSLGLTLYELLAARPAFDEKERHKLIKQVTNAEPVRLDRLKRAIPRDLVTVVHKAIEREPAHRYPSAADLAADLQRFLDDEPIHARRTSAVERLARWSRRNKALAAALGGVAALLVLLTLGALLVAKQQSDMAGRNQGLADDNRSAWKAAEAAREKAEVAEKRALTTVADMQTGRGLLAAERGDPATALLWFANAAMLTPHDPRRQQENRLRARNWMDQAILPVAAQSLAAAPGLVQFQPGGDLLLARDERGRCLLWNWRTDALLPWVKTLPNATAVCWKPDGSEVAFGLNLKSANVQIRAVPSGKLVQRFDHPGLVRALAFRPDGQHLAIASDVVRVWKLKLSPVLEHHWFHPQPVHSLVFAAKGDRLATACEDKQVRVFAVGPDGKGGEPLFAPIAHDPHRASPPAFIDGDRGLLTITQSKGLGVLGWWDAETGQPTRRGTIKTATSQPDCVVASPDGQRFAVAEGSRAAVWDVSDDQTPPRAFSHLNSVMDLSFSPDGAALLTVSWDRTARLESLTDRKPVGLPLHHMGIVTHCGFSADGTHLVTAQKDGLIRIWKRPDANQVMTPVRNWSPMQPARVRPSFDGRLAAPGIWHESPYATTRSPKKPLVICETGTGKPAGPAIQLDGSVVDSCICADNRSVAVVSLQAERYRLSLHDVLTGKALVPPQPLPGLPRCVAGRPNRPQVAVLDVSGTLLVFDSRDGKLLHEWQHAEGQAKQPHTRTMYTPDGLALVTLLAGGNRDYAVVVRNADTGEVRFPAIHPVLKGGPCRSIAISADSRLLATAVNGTNAVQVWDLASGLALCRPLLHPGEMFGVFKVAFSPDGRYVLSAGTNYQAHLWDWRKGELACPALQHDDEVYDGAVTDDGRHALTASRDGTLRVWDLTTGKLVAAPMRLAPSLRTVTVRAQRALLTSGDANCLLVDLSRLLEKPHLADDGLRLLGELATAQRIAQGDLSGLTSEQWAERWQRFRERGLAPADSAESTARDLDRAAGAEAKRKIAERAAWSEHVLTELIRLRPEEPALYAALARRLETRGDREAAARQRAKGIALYEAYLAKEPGRADVATDLTGLLLESGATNWMVLKPAALRSEGGATLTLQQDGSVLASGIRSDRDSYTITAPLDVRRLTAIRLEALAYPSLPAQGPGRFANGNFHLTEARAQHLTGPGHETPLVLAAATADYVRPPDGDTTEYDGPRGVIDGKQHTHWDIWPQVGQDHWIAFQLARPQGLAAGEQLVVELDFRSRWTHHSLGRFRLSVTDRADPLLVEQLRRAVTGGELRGFAALAAGYFVQGKVERVRAILAHRVAEEADGGVAELLLLTLAQQRLRQPEQARQSYDQASERLERHEVSELVRVLAWQAMTEVALLRPAEADKRLVVLSEKRALAPMTAAIAANPKDPKGYILRGQWQALRARWKEGAADLANAVRLAPDDHWTAYQLAALLAYSNEKDAYRPLCESLLERWGNTADVTLAERTARVCLLLPEQIDPGRLDRLVKTALTAEKTHVFYRWFLVAQGLHAYRSRNFAGAVSACAESRKRNGPVQDFSLTVQDHAVEAMALHRLRKTDEARRSLTAAKQVAEEKLANLVGVDRPHPWHDWVMAQLLLREAQALIEGKNTEPKK